MWSSDPLVGNQHPTRMGTATTQTCVMAGHILKERKMRESTTMTTGITELENAYCAAAAELRSKQAGLQNYADELDKFIEVRDKLQEHPDFSGNLPETYFSGGDLDPVGVSPKVRPARIRP